MFYFIHRCIIMTKETIIKINWGRISRGNKLIDTWLEYLIFLWKKKWLISIFVSFSIIVVGVITFVITPVYTIEFIIQPAKFFAVKDNGNLELIVVESPQQISDKINQESLNSVLVQELGINERNFPSIKSEVIKDTLLVRAWINSRNVKSSMTILSRMIDLLRVNMDSKVEVEKSNIEMEIQKLEIEKERRIKEIKLLENRFKILDQRQDFLQEIINQTGIRLQLFEKQLRSTLQKETKSDVETMGMLLYSSEIQKGLRYYNELNEKLSQILIQKKNIQSNIQNQNAEINKINSMAMFLQKKKGWISFTTIVKPPESSLRPIFPHKFEIIFCFGLFTSLFSLVFGAVIFFLKKRK